MKLILCCLLLICSQYLLAQSVGIGTTIPNASAQLDISSNSKGLLIPRMNTSVINTISNPAKGLMIYDSALNRLVINTGTASSPGWQQVGNSSGWNLTGNSGTNPSTNFIGTTDNNPIRFRINNKPAGHVDSIYGSVFLGYRAGNQFNNYDNVGIGFKSLYAATSFGSNNVALGSYSLYSNAAGSANIGIGRDALYSNTSGGANIAIGNGTMFSNTDGTGNTAIGYSALRSTAAGNYNTAVGYEALYYNNAHGNSAFGSNSMTFNTTGSQNAAFGHASLNRNETGVNNAAFGYQALNANQAGGQNSAFGSQALLVNAVGENNSAFGYQALAANTTGNKNSAIGWAALLKNTTGYYNAAMGDGAMLGNIVGIGNTAMGSGALFSTGGASYNTALGYHAGFFYEAGWNNTLIGAETGINAAGIYNAVALGNGTVITASNQARIGNGSTISIGGYANWTNMSDGRYKKNINENVNGLDFIMKLRPVTYHLDIVSLDKKLNGGEKKEWNATMETAVKEKEQIVQSGFIAQEVENAAKETGYDFSGVDKPKNENDLYGLRYAEFVVPLVKAVQEQQQQIADMKKEVNLVKEQNKLLMQLLEKKN